MLAFSLFSGWLEGSKTTREELRRASPLPTKIPEEPNFLGLIFHAFALL
jgi:hypothetical protein